MTERRSFSRRRLIETAGGAALTAGLAPAVFVPRRANSMAHKTLKILQWNHFVPEFDQWFNEVYVKEWRERNGVKVIVDNVGMTSLNSRAQAEIRTTAPVVAVVDARPSLSGGVRHLVVVQSDLVDQEFVLVGLIVGVGLGCSGSDLSRQFGAEFDGQGVGGEMLGVEGQDSSHGVLP